jgi:hypothetical protein
MGKEAGEAREGGLFHRGFSRAWGDPRGALESA